MVHRRLVIHGYTRSPIQGKSTSWKLHLTNIHQQACRNSGNSSEPRSIRFDGPSGFPIYELKLLCSMSCVRSGHLHQLIILVADSEELLILSAIVGEPQTGRCFALAAVSQLYRSLHRVKIYSMISETSVIRGTLPRHVIVTTHGPRTELAHGSNYITLSCSNDEMVR
jgi:hypothetical protein